jgi:hypothetical protein
LNSLLKLLGYRQRQYQGDGFSVRIKSKFREGVSLDYESDGKSYEFLGERSGKRWEGIRVAVPSAMTGDQAREIARDLEIAFKAMDYKYVIEHGLETLGQSG